MVGDPMTAVLHCPDCGAVTREDRQPDGWVYAVCTDDECPRVVVDVLARPSQRWFAGYDEPTRRGAA
jgi:hypothetical protein